MEDEYGFINNLERAMNEISDEGWEIFQVEIDDMGRRSRYKACTFFCKKPI